LALAALALVVFGASDSYPSRGSVCFGSGLSVEVEALATWSAVRAMGARSPLALLNAVAARAEKSCVSPASVSKNSDTMRFAVHVYFKDGTFKLLCSSSRR